jgi:hypothetical protein
VLAARTVAGGARVVAVVPFVFEKGFPLKTVEPLFFNRNVDRFGFRE